MIWVKPVLLLLLLMVPVQWGAYLKMQSEMDAGFRDLAQKKGKETASTIALVVFLGFAVLPPFFLDADWTKFTAYMPFKVIYPTVKNTLKVQAAPGGATADDKKTMLIIYRWIWRVVTFMIPAIVYVIVNTVVTGLVWEHYLRTR